MKKYYITILFITNKNFVFLNISICLLLIHKYNNQLKCKCLPVSWQVIVTITITFFFKLKLKKMKKSLTIMMRNSSHRLNEEIIRCGWLNDDPLYISYHDNEWGKPAYDNIYLFEMLCLEGQQAGLSWITILKKRDNYRKLFCNFNPNEIVQFNDNDVKRLLSNPDIVRHKGKIEAIIKNSKCYIEMKMNGEDFSKFVWNFVDNNPIVNNWTNDEEVPSSTVTSLALSKALKKKGFKYVGSTTCYAFMQACGLVNDHVYDCISRN